MTDVLERLEMMKNPDDRRKMAGEFLAEAKDCARFRDAKNPINNIQPLIEDAMYLLGYK